MGLDNRLTGANRTNWAYQASWGTREDDGRLQRSGRITFSEVGEIEQYAWSDIPLAQPSLALFSPLNDKEGAALAGSGPVLELLDNNSVRYAFGPDDSRPVFGVLHRGTGSCQLIDGNHRQFGLKRAFCMARVGQKAGHKGQ